jgi:hypothetical protein
LRLGLANLDPEPGALLHQTTIRNVFSVHYHNSNLAHFDQWLPDLGSRNHVNAEVIKQDFKCFNTDFIYLQSDAFER